MPTPRSEWEALLVVDGEFPSSALMVDLAKSASIVVATDGAGARLLDIGIRPDIVIGDLDAPPSQLERVASDGIRLIKIESQESGDMDKALGWLFGEGYHRVALVGIGGGMLDHTLNNFSILARLSGSMDLRILENRSVCYVIGRHMDIKTQPGERISLIPLPHALLCTQGLAWDLDNEELVFGIGEGGSNRATGSKVTVDVIEGRVGLFHYKLPFKT